MGLNETPSAERIHIGFFGRRNAGKSSVVNAFTSQELSIVSDVLGTTTDPVYKAMAVSYTHLDVYKRQPVTLSGHSSPVSGSTILHSISGRLPPTVATRTSRGSSAELIVHPGEASVWP